MPVHSRIVLPGGRARRNMRVLVNGDAAGAVPATAILTEAGAPLLTEAGAPLLTE